MAFQAKKKRVLIAAGGTGGHVFPGLAIAEKINEKIQNAEVIFAGTALGLESKILPQKGYELSLLPSYPLKGKKGIVRLKAMLHLPISIYYALRTVIKYSPSLYIGIGGYAAGPLAIACFLTGIPVILVEPNAIAGLTNRVSGKFAKKVCVTFDQAKKYFKADKVLQTGNPVRKDILSVKKDLSSPKDVFSIFVFGGSQGAMALNNAMRSVLNLRPEWLKKVQIFHQTGKHEDLDALSKAYSAAGIKAELQVFIDDMSSYYQKADLVISRAGATTIAELAALAIPSILIPYPSAADDHQRANAKSIADVGGAIILDEKECSGERLSQEIGRLLDSKDALVQMHNSLLASNAGSAADRIVAVCETYLS